MMKLDSILIILIFNALFWSKINSVKNNKDKNELSRVGETSKDNDGAESSVNAQIQKFEGTLKPKPKITKKDKNKDNEEEKKFNRKEYMKNYVKNNKESKQKYDQEYRKNNREKKREYLRKYRQDNKEKRREWDQKYRKNNKEKLAEYRQNNKEKRKESARKYRLNNKNKKREYNQKYRENNLEKYREDQRKYREKMKNKKVNLQNVEPTVGHMHSDNDSGTPFVNTQKEFRNEGKVPIVFEEGIRSEEGNDFNQEEEEGNKDEAETNANEQNQQVVEEPNKIPENCMNQINLNEYPFDLNAKPED